jgi:hypothetical protein
MLCCAVRRMAQRPSRAFPCFLLAPAGRPGAHHARVRDRRAGCRILNPGAAEHPSRSRRAHAALADGGGLHQPCQARLSRSAGVVAQRRRREDPGCGRWHGRARRPVRGGRGARLTLAHHRGPGTVAGFAAAGSCAELPPRRRAAVEARPGGHAPGRLAPRRRAPTARGRLSPAAGTMAVRPCPAAPGRDPPPGRPGPAGGALTEGS